MVRTVNWLAAFILLAALAPAADLATAGSFTVVPTRLVLEAGRQSASLSVRNDGQDPVLVQIEPLRWTRAVPAIETVPADELLAVPTVFRLAPGGEQTVRVGLRRPFQGEQEATYRLLVSEVPTPQAAPEGGVRFALRFSIPVFVTPAQALPRLVPELVQRDGRWLLLLHNRGTAHLRLAAMRLFRTGGNTPLVEADPGYLLAGETRALEVSGAGMRIGSTFRLEVETQGGARSFELVVGSS